MELDKDKNGNIILRKVYNGVGFETEGGEKLSVCMRDSGYEFTYNDITYEAKDGEISLLGSDEDILMGILERKLKGVMDNPKVEKKVNEFKEKLVKEGVDTIFNTFLKKKKKT